MEEGRRQVTDEELRGLDLETEVEMHIDEAFAREHFPMCGCFTSEETGIETRVDMYNSAQNVSDAIMDMVNGKNMCGVSVPYFMGMVTHLVLAKATHAQVGHLPFNDVGRMKYTELLNTHTKTTTDRMEALNNRAITILHSAGPKEKMS